MKQDEMLSLEYVSFQLIASHKETQGIFWK